MDVSFDIPVSRFGLLASRVSRAGTRARQHGLPVPRLVKGPEWDRHFEIHDPLALIRGAATDRRTLTARMVTVTVEGFLPQADGWKIVGYRSASKDKAWSTPGVPAEIAARPLCCDHCGYARRRKVSFVVQGPEGQTVEVGSNCLGDYTGHRGFGAYAEGLVELSSILRALEAAAKEDLLASGHDLEEEVRTVLAVAIRNIGENGYRTKEGGGTPTWMEVMEDLATLRSPGCKPETVPVTAMDFRLADDIVEAVLSSNPYTDFGIALDRTVQRGLAGMRDVALLTAAAAGHLRKLAAEEEKRAERRVSASSSPIGSPGERIEFVGRVRTVREVETAYGTLHMVAISDPEGNLVLWKTGSPKGVKPGRAYALKGTVKEHRRVPSGPFEGLVETVVTRVAVQADLGPASAPTPRDEEDDDALDAILSFVSPGV